MKKFLFLLLVPLIVFAQIEQRTVIEKSMSANPSVGILRFQGDPALRGKLEEILVRCGWFKLASDPARADVKIQARGQSGRLETRVDGLGQSFQTARQTNGNDLVVYQTVDDILNKLFQVKGLCTHKIYYVVTATNGMKEIFACYLDGKGQERVTMNNAISTEPSWGNHDSLVYTLIRNNSLLIILAEPDRKRHRVVSRFRGLNSSARLSPDGRTLALPLSVDNQVELYLLDINSGRRTRLTRDKNVESSPTWSPDGRRLCYVSDKFGVPLVFLRDLSTGQETRLGLGIQETVSPEWSPVSNKVCFSYKQSGGQRVLAVVDMKRQPYETKIVTTAAGNWETPSWAPDGRHVVCTRSLNGGRTRDLYIVDTLTGEFRAVSKGAKLALPAWRP